jgi:hypothetical protein
MFRVADLCKERSPVELILRALHPKITARRRRGRTGRIDPRLRMAISSDGTVTIVAHRSEMGCRVARHGH